MKSDVVCIDYGVRLIVTDKYLDITKNHFCYQNQFLVEY